MQWRYHSLAASHGHIAVYSTSLYSDVIMSTMVFQITGISIVCSAVQAPIKENIKALHHWPLTMTSGFLSQKASNAENVSIWWCHHALEQVASALPENLITHLLVHPVNKLQVLKQLKFKWEPYVNTLLNWQLMRYIMSIHGGKGFMMYLFYDIKEFGM